MNLRGAVSAWNTFWFEPISTAPLAVFRIVYGLIALGWSIAMIPVLDGMFTRHGVLPHQPTFSGQQGGAWGLFSTFESKTAVTVAVVIMILAAIALTVGFVPQLAALVLLIGLISFERRDPFAFNAGDVLVRVIAFYMIFAPSGAALSVDRLLRHEGSFWDFPGRPPWAMRLLQIQLSVVYLFAVWAKVQGTTWNAGTAVSYALRVHDIGRFPLPNSLTTSPLFSNVFSYGTLAIELSLAILIWNRKLRPYVLLAGVSLHLGIEYSLRVGFYGITIMSMYILFVPEAWLERAALAVRGRVSRPGVASASVPTETVAPG